MSERDEVWRDWAKTNAPALSSKDPCTHCFAVGTEVHDDDCVNKPPAVGTEAYRVWVESMGQIVLC